MYYEVGQKQKEVQFLYIIISLKWEISPNEGENKQKEAGRSAYKEVLSKS